MQEQFYHVCRTVTTSYVIKARNEQEAHAVAESFLCTCSHDDEAFATYSEDIDVEVYAFEYIDSNTVYIDYLDNIAKTLED